jgi:hypothetical protein
MSPPDHPVIVALWLAKQQGKHLTAYCTSTVPIQFQRWNKRHPVAENITFDTVPAGTTLKIVMVSRLGDVGLTDDLTAEYGYQVRVYPEDGEIVDIRWERETRHEQ